MIEDRLAYQRRAEAVYWNRATPACRAKGPNKAVCLLEPGHEGDHEGNGYDTFNTLYRRWS